jgi:hypothetical protein
MTYYLGNDIADRSPGRAAMSTNDEREMRQLSSNAWLRYGPKGVSLAHRCRHVSPTLSAVDALDSRAEGTGSTKSWTGRYYQRGSPPGA